jgi:hypothetical protein
MAEYQAGTRAGKVGAQSVRCQPLRERAGDVQLVDERIVRGPGEVNRRVAAELDHQGAVVRLLAPVPDFALVAGLMVVSQASNSYGS